MDQRPSSSSTQPINVVPGEKRKQNIKVGSSLESEQRTMEDGTEVIQILIVNPTHFHFPVRIPTYHDLSYVRHQYFLLTPP